MSDEFWSKTSLSDKKFSPSILNKNHIQSIETNHKTLQEVFRNDTTAVEVIVKQVNNKNKNMEPNKLFMEEINDRLCKDIDLLKTELSKAKLNLEETKKRFGLIMFEMAKQLEAANQRELKRQTKYLVQQLEKEKLKTILDSKINIVKKQRKELLNVKRIIKLVIKGIPCFPLSDSAKSNQEYAEFVNDIKANMTKASIVHTINEITRKTTLSSNA